MSRWTRAAAVALAVGGGAVGCHSVGTGDRPGADDRWAKYVDPSYPERYNHAARQEVLSPFATMVGNAQVQEHTVFNFHFETGSEKLTPGGLLKLDELARERPAPQGRVYLQTAHDLQYDPTEPE
ncbi:MAG: hypothetical protein ACRC7O_15935, partial [Fimbriiglobus sp.]